MKLREFYNRTAEFDGTEEGKLLKQFLTEKRKHTWLSDDSEIKFDEFRSYVKRQAPSFDLDAIILQTKDSPLRSLIREWSNSDYELNEEHASLRGTLIGP